MPLDPAVLLANIVQPNKVCRRQLLSAELWIRTRGWYTSLRSFIYRGFVYEDRESLQCISFVTTYVIVMIQWSETTDPDDPLFHGNNNTIIV